MSTLAATNLKHASSASNNIVLASDGTTTIAAPSNIIKSGTAVASTSGTSIDFTGIPSWVKRITLMLDQVSTNGTSNCQIQLGDSGGVETSGYTGNVAGTDTPSNLTSFSSGFLITFGLSTAAACGTFTFTLINASTNTWVTTGIFASPASSQNLRLLAGLKALSATLDRVRVTTVNGTDTFDAGTINILYEG